MLQSIHVKNLALIEETEVEFKEGLNIITGETGAGKSLLIGSVNLALGSKFDSSMLRKGADSGIIELVFYDESEAIKNKLSDMDLQPSEDGTIILTRKLSQGKSSCKINGETVTIKQVQEVADLLIDIHGQHEHQSLLKKQKHLEILDAFGEKELKDLLSETARVYKEHKKALDELDANKKDTSEIDREKALLEFECNEIDEANLHIGEDEELEALYRKMSNGRKIIENLSQAYSNTSEGQTNASLQIGQALRCVSNVSEFDDNLKSLENQLFDIENLLNDFNREISSYMSDYEFEEEEFKQVSDRLDLINNLKRKYGSSIEDIIKYADDSREKLSKFADYDSYIERLEIVVQKLEKELLDSCEKLSATRRKLAVKLSEKLVTALQNLNFLTVEFEIRIDKANISAKGFDEATFMISTNPGETLKPLENVASGGELSRIMLAIKTIMASQDEIDTLIFDEIDTGISGKTAWKVSEQLGLLGKHHQVLCITHLPQIAAMADAHYVIEKNALENETKTNVRFIAGDESAYELARLLGSDERSEAALENARDMINKAREYKTNI